MNVHVFEPNLVGRDFVVGDLHGHSQMFWQVLHRAGVNLLTDRVFSVGDLVDRGPDSLGCLALLRHPWFHGVWGNHDDAMARTAAGNPTEWIEKWGGRWWLSCTAEQKAQALDDASRLSYAMVVHCRDGSRFNVVHAEWHGSDAELAAGGYSKSQKACLMWSRDLISGECLPPEDLSPTYVGHSIVSMVRRIGSHIYIDTGAYRPDGRLTLLEPATGNSWSVEQQGEWM
ncbi:metallophosphoesterase [Nevskia ramosa]|uniref:metallophosphoesterase n=1 Tax=Nevskia ramosa TaxID=64002 RepID=UPI003D0A8C7E